MRLLDLKRSFNNINLIIKNLKKIQATRLIENLGYRKLLRATILNHCQSLDKVGIDRKLKNTLSSMIIKAFNSVLNREKPVQIQWGIFALIFTR